MVIEEFKIGDTIYSIRKESASHFFENRFRKPLIGIFLGIYGSSFSIKTKEGVSGGEFEVRNTYIIKMVLIEKTTIKNE